MSHPSAPKTLEDLQSFRFERVLNEDPLTHTLTLLGKFTHTVENELEESNSSSSSDPGPVQAIVRIEKTALDAKGAARYLARDGGLIERVQIEESTDIYTWLFGWFGEERERDVKINVICPATETHIRKYTKQKQIMVRETPELYRRVVKPYIDAFPPSRTQWVENILNGLSEQNKILFSNDDFVILPDMKWDLKTLASLYLVAIVKDRAIKSLRDLRKAHIPLLQAIREQATRVASERWGFGEDSLRMYVHYQPSYYHFHVHIVNANCEGGVLGMMVGQAHLIDDIISLLEVDSSDGSEDGILQRMTLTYSLGAQHGLMEKIQSFLSPS